LIFSDDIQWCKNHFIGNEFTFIEGFEDWEDLILMSLCDANIITNSTFSWWARWLSKNNEMTVAPNKWFNYNSNENIFSPPGINTSFFTYI
jgi:hypothetical protein